MDAPLSGESTRWTGMLSVILMMTLCVDSSARLNDLAYFVRGGSATSGGRPCAGELRHAVHRFASSAGVLEPPRVHRDEHDWVRASASAGDSVVHDAIDRREVRSPGSALPQRERERLRDAKGGDHCRSTREQDVVRLDVTVHDATRVRELECPRRAWRCRSRRR